MNFGDLKAFVRANKELPNHTELVVIGHYGEIDSATPELEVGRAKVHWEGKHSKTVIAVTGVNPTYPAPD